MEGVVTPGKRRTAKLSDHQKDSLRVVLQLAERAPAGLLTEEAIERAVGEQQHYFLLGKGLLEIVPSSGLWKLTETGKKRAEKIRRAWDRDRRKAAPPRKASKP
jgi:hypothetical protein